MKGCALITGASSGIGRVLLEHFAADGIDMVITARDVAALTKAAEDIRRRHDVAVFVIPADLSIPGESARLHKEISSRDIQIAYLVNNAGFGNYGLFQEADAEKIDAIVQVNVASLVSLTRLFLPAMVSEGRGKILQVASVAAFQPGPLMAVYYATKAFVLSFSEAVSEELRGTGVSMTCLCPGPVVTQFAKRANFNHSRLFQKNHAASAEDVARYAYRAMLKGKTVAVHGLGNRIIAFANRLLPRKTVVRLVRFVQEKRS
ncbi:MAG: SDR family oxidoreductase [Victivallales bacterium]|nr:SDR family oxidoreductase [Victivallales bacterium]